jgi:hypothetical protein
MKKLLNKIIGDLEAVTISAGALEKILGHGVSGDLVLNARKEAARDIEKHFSDLREAVSRLPDD